MKHLTKIADMTQDDIHQILDLAFEFKKKFAMGIRKENILNGKMVAMVFEKPSLRTKVAFEIATEYLGGTAVYLSNSQILASGGHIQGRESIPDIARNLDRFSDLILARVYNHSTIVDIVEHVKNPVINALCDLHHPTQALADLMTLKWHKPDVDKLKVAYIGDGNNVAVSLMQIMTLMGHDFAFAGPQGFQIPEAAIKEIESKGTGSITILEDPAQALMNADAVYTDTFISMGQEDERAQRLKQFEGYQVNLDRFESANPGAIFMHCLPAHRGEEVTDNVMDHNRSVVFDQAECRMHIAKALLVNLLA